METLGSNCPNRVIPMAEAEGMQTEGEYVCATCGDPLNIIGIIQHAETCEQVLDASVLSRKERNTLMYIETRVVDHGGELDPRQMNYEDQQNIKLFGAAGILDVAEPEVHHSDPRRDQMQVVKFTDQAWDLVRDSRQMRAAQDMDPEAVGLPPEGGEDGQ